MIKIARDNFLTVLDLGTSKTTIFIAHLDKNGSLSVRYSSLVDTRGMQKGLITDLGGISDTVSEAVRLAEEKSKVRIASLLVSISTPDLRGQKIKASVPISDKPSQITPKDLERVKLAAKNIAVPFDREVVHMIAQSYAVDGQGNIDNPLGLAGTHLEGNFYLITASSASVQNIIRAINNVGVNILGLVFSGWALSQSVLSPEEKNDGVILLDFGAGTTKVVIFARGQLKAIDVIPLGGDSLTEMLSNKLCVPLRTAEELKRRYPTMLSDSSQEAKIIFSNENLSQSISRRQFSQLLNKEWSNILDQVLARAKKAVTFNQIASGIVVSGGCILADGSLEKIENTFSLPVRLAVSKGISDQDLSRIHNPIYTTSYSLINYVRQNYRLSRPGLPTPKNLWGKVMVQTKEIMQDYF